MPAHPFLGAPPGIFALPAPVPTQQGRCLAEELSRPTAGRVGWSDLLGMYARRVQIDRPLRTRTSKEQKGYSRAINRIPPSQTIRKGTEEPLNQGLDGEADVTNVLRLDMNPAAAPFADAVPVERADGKAP